MVFPGNFHWNFTDPFPLASKLKQNRKKNDSMIFICSCFILLLLIKRRSKTFYFDGPLFVI